VKILEQFPVLKILWIDTEQAKCHVIKILHRNLLGWNKTVISGRFALYGLRELSTYEREQAIESPDYQRETRYGVFGRRARYNA
jgi:hypothetical protein